MTMGDGTDAIDALLWIQIMSPVAWWQTMVNDLGKVTGEAE